MTATAALFGDCQDRFLGAKRCFDGTGHPRQEAAPCRCLGKTAPTSFLPGAGRGAFLPGGGPSLPWRGHGLSLLSRSPRLGSLLPSGGRYRSQTKSGCRTVADEVGRAKPPRKMPFPLPQFLRAFQEQSHGVRKIAFQGAAMRQGHCIGIVVHLLACVCLDQRLACGAFGGQRLGGFVALLL